MKKNSQILTTILFFLGGTSLLATNYYVSPTIGNNSYSGLSTSLPKQTIQAASDLTNAGDVVYLMNGTYTAMNSAGDNVTITRSGTATGYITYTKFAGHNPLIKPTSWNAIKITNGASYIIIDGLTIQGNNANLTLVGAQAQPGGCPSVGTQASPVTPNSGTRNGTYNSNGIYVDGSGTATCHHVIVKNCEVYDCSGGGIASKEADYITFEYNRVHDNCQYGAYGSSGMSNLNNQNWDNNTTDFKIIVRNNMIYNNEMLVGWYGYYCDITDGNGIIFDKNRNISSADAYTGKSLCENNICFNNGGRGIHNFYSDNVTVRNNTSYNNGKSTRINDGEMTGHYVANINMYNNIMYARTGEPANTRSNHSNFLVGNNLIFNGTNNFGGSNNVTTDPKFTNIGGNDFTLQTTSPAINAGTNTAGQFATQDFLNVARPIGPKPDIGAYESASGVMPIALVSFKGYLVNEKVVLQWLTASEINAKAFIIEKSKNGKDFIAIGTVAAKNKNEASAYTFDDDRLTENLHYYRLKMLDNDGTFRYCNVVTIQTTFKKTETLSIFPNPVAHTLTVNHVEATEDRLIKIVAVGGNTIAQYRVSKNTVQTNINVNQLIKGYYFVQYISKGEILTTSFVK